MVLDQDSWEVNRIHISKELTRLADSLDQLAVEQRKVLTEIAMLKVKSGLWGALAGAIPSFVAIVYVLVTAKP